MFRMSTIAGVAAASMLATSAVFFGATGSIASSPVAEPSAASVSITQTVSTVSAAAVASVAPETASPEGCARKVKVVYAGYGEAGLGCATIKR